MGQYLFSCSYIVSAGVWLLVCRACRAACVGNSALLLRTVVLMTRDGRAGAGPDDARRLGFWLCRLRLYALFFLLSFSF